MCSRAILNIWIKVSDKKMEFSFMKEKEMQTPAAIKWKQVNGFGEIK